MFNFSDRFRNLHVSDFNLVCYYRVLLIKLKNTFQSAVTCNGNPSFIVAVKERD